MAKQKKHFSSKGNVNLPKTCTEWIKNNNTNKTVFFSIIQAAWWKNCNWGHLLEGAHFVS